MDSPLDSHVAWLRGKIIASVAKQSAATFAIGAVVVFVLLQIFTSLGILLAVLIALVVGLAIAAGRVYYSLQNNPLNYRFMRRAVDRPFGYQVARFEGESVAHRAAEDLPGFDPVATIRNHEAEPPVVIDVYHNAARLVAATVNRSSGVTGLITSLAGGRFLLTDSRPQPPHERLVMNNVRHATMQETVAAHQNALAERADVVSLEESAHQVVLESLAVEHEAYVGLGPTVAPFLNLYRSKSTLLSLIAKIDRREIAKLPIELGPDIPSLTAPRAWTPQPVTTISMPDDDEAPEIVVARPDAQVAGEEQVATSPQAEPSPAGVPHVEALQLSLIHI